jgi:hypothetical protein
MYELIIINERLILLLIYFFLFKYQFKKLYNIYNYTEIK